ncbi:serine/threonine-protein kinase [Streptomyces misionensis]|uniref:serine/threonine-protein kinase n=1 Tax=Streptomyces misionensis TaxID=67331 RepID=UPI00367B94AC
MHAIGQGTVLGDRYALDRPLGRGSMGQVWQGRDLHLERPIAVKIVAAELFAEAEDRDRARRRFVREAKAAAALDSANIATVYDAAVAGDTHWLVMQLVDGATLGTLIDEAEEERLDVASAAAVAAQICSGLAAAHAAGLVHRDLKPENVMIRRDGVVKILDFGLVKLMADDGPKLTATGEQPGNLRYASPELLSGEAVLDGRSDLYSVGCLLHHMLAGTPPFPGERPMAVLRGHLHDAPPSLSAVGVPVPEALQELLLALLAKDCEDRPASAAEVYGALGPWLPTARPGPGTLHGFAPEDPRRPFVLPQSPYPV